MNDPPSPDEVAALLRDYDKVAAESGPKPKRSRAGCLVSVLAIFTLFAIPAANRVWGLGISRKTVALLALSLLGVAAIGVVLQMLGGALAAGVAQKALDRGENPICAQILIYPVTDHETKSESALRFNDTPFWKTASNRNMWDVYLSGSEHKRVGGSAPVPPYAAPLHRESFAGLPPAWVEVAEFDPLIDEGRQYAEALQAAGVVVDLREAKAAIHGYDLVEDSPTAEAMFKERIAGIQRFFGNP